MSKLRARIGVMGSGKTSTIFGILHDYKAMDKKYLILKPFIDTKGGKNIINRQGETLDVDYYIFHDEFEIGFIHEITNNKIDIIIVDECQFVEPIMIKELSKIAHINNIPIIAFGLTNDSNANPFPGMSQLLAIADEIEEITTRKLCSHCKSGKRANMHLKYINGVITFDENKQVQIDDDSLVEYKAVCSKCYWEQYLKHK